MPAAPPAPPINLPEVVPTAADLKGLEPTGAPEQAEGEALFRLINGGADVFLRAGFQRAVMQEYGKAPFVVFTLEVYEMGTPTGAREVYAAKGGVEGGKAVVGEASTVESYYGLFRQGRFFFTVTASDEGAGTRETVERIARAVVARLAGK